MTHAITAEAAPGYFTHPEPIRETLEEIQQEITALVVERLFEMVRQVTIRSQEGYRQNDLNTSVANYASITARIRDAELRLRGQQPRRVVE